MCYGMGKIVQEIQCDMLTFFKKHFYKEIKDLYNLNMSLDVNGKRMQTGNTSKMIHKMNFLNNHFQLNNKMEYYNNFLNNFHNLFLN